MYLENYNRLYYFNSIKELKLKKGANTLEMMNGSVSDQIMKETKTFCNLCQNVPCGCARPGVTPISSHLIMPNFLNPLYPIEHQNFLTRNPIYAMDVNLLHYHNMQAVIPPAIPIPSPPLSSSSPSPPSHQNSPNSSADRRPSKRVKKFACNRCQKSFDYKHVLQNHMRTHTGEKPFRCEVCSKKFTRDHHLKTHKRLHTGEKPYLCEYCDMRFVQVANLRRHLKVHDAAKSNNCDKRFPEMNRIGIHIQENSSMSEPDVVCGICRANYHHETKCPLRMNTLRISHGDEIDDDSDAVSSGDSHTSSGSGSDQIAQYETESIPQVLDLSKVDKNSTQSEPEDLSMKKYY